jgi:hypothetical protein
MLNLGDAGLAPVLRDLSTEVALGNCENLARIYAQIGCFAGRLRGASRRTH